MKSIRFTLVVLLLAAFRPGKGLCSWTFALGSVGFALTPSRKEDLADRLYRELRMYIPTSLCCGCARPREIGPGRLTSRVFHRNDERERVVAR
jgi:hypothetical protein